MCASHNIGGWEMNFSKINYQSFLGKLIRLPLHLIPKTMVLPILQGGLRGKKWIVGSGEHGYWLGSYEYQKRLAFEKNITQNTVVYDIGANVGYFSLLAAVLTGPQGQVVAFEPLPRNVAFLNKHIAINCLDNIKLIEAAVSDREGKAAFTLGASTAMGHIGETGEIEVALVSLDALLDKGVIKPPDTIKIDVEGAEFEVLKGARNILSQYRPILFLDTHHREVHQKVIQLLSDMGYQFTILDGKTLAETKEIIARPK
jgi:FkbM family methyltransferase